MRQKLVWSAINLTLIGIIAVGTASPAFGKAADIALVLLGLGFQTFIWARCEWRRWKINRLRNFRALPAEPPTGA
jgi:hypothetical protein